MLNGEPLLLAFIVIVMAFAWDFSGKVIVLQESTNERSVKLSFCIVLCSACSMYMLMLYEIMEYMEPMSRLVCMQTVLFILTLMILIVPYQTIAILFSSIGVPGRHVPLITSIVYMALLTAFFAFTSLFPLSYEAHSLFSTESFLSRVCILGVTAMAQLSGFAAVKCSEMYITRMVHRVEASEIQESRNLIRNTLEALLEKQRQLAGVSESSSTTWRNRVGNKSVGGRILDLVHGSSGSMETQRRSLQNEIFKLENIQRRQFTDLLDLQTLYTQQSQPFSFRRVYTDVLGYAVSALCIHKMITSTLNVVLNRERTKDPVTSVFEFLSNYFFHFDIDTSLWSQQLSFLLVAVLAVSQIRNLLRQCMKISSIASAWISEEIVLLLLTEVMGMYFLSSIVMFRMNIPEMYRKSLTAAIGNIEFQFYYTWFDAIFVVSATTSILWFLLSRSIDSRK